MPVYKHETLAGWGNTPAITCRTFRPEKIRGLHDIVERYPERMIARGLGRSYGDAALQPHGTIRCERLDHFLSFDQEQGILSAQAGASLADVMHFSIPRGWLPPVIPGTRHVTLGGALACNVHGKNHFREGDFAEHVHSFVLLLANGERVVCSPTLLSDLFWATAGGMGMTGIIEEVTLKLKPIASCSLQTTICRVGNLGDMVAAFEHHRPQSDYMIGWIDHTATGDDIGRGVFEAANHISPAEGGRPVSAYAARKTRLSVPFSMPSFALNRYSMAWYNRWRFKKYSDEKQENLVGFDGFFHPLDGISNWNRLYGKAGFFQYQCVIPETPDIASRLRTFLSAIHEQHLFSFLAVIKYHRAGQGLLTFPLQGYSIALDFPNTARVRALLPQLSRWVADHGGRIYLAKDALLTPDVFHKMYGAHAEPWRGIIHEADPHSRFSSLMSERLQWKAPR